MIYCDLIKIFSICIKKDNAKQTGLTKSTSTGLIIMLFLEKSVFVI